MSENEKNELEMTEDAVAVDVPETVTSDAPIAVLSEESAEGENGAEVKVTAEPDAERAEGDHLADLQAKNQKMKKRVLMIFGGVVLGIALLFGALLLVEHLIEQRRYEEPTFDYDFYPPYVGDIMQYSPYLALNRKVFYCADPSGYGANLEVSEETLSNFDNRVSYLYFYLQTVIAGDEQMYNALFNETYYEKHQPHGAFYPQMIYDASIRYQGGEDQSNGDRLELYVLSYKIHRNDGSFRRDIGSDMSREQLITLRVSREKGITVENLVTVYTN